MGCLKLQYHSEQEPFFLKVVKPDKKGVAKGVQMFLSVDPLQQEYPSLNPYNFCANNPIMLIDVDGRDIWVGFEATHDGHSGHTTIMYTTYQKVEVEVNGAMQTMYRQVGYAVAEHNQWNIRMKTMGDYQNWETTDPKDADRAKYLSSKQDSRIKINTATGTVINGTTYYTYEQVEKEKELEKYAQKKEDDNKGKSTFNLETNNCTDYAAEILRTSGIKTNGKEKVYFTHKSGNIVSVANPNALFKWMKSQITSGKKPNWKIEKESNEIKEDPKPTMQNY